MSARQSSGRKPVFSASAILDAIAAELSTIKHEDGLTDADVAAVLGKSEDQAAKYRTGLAEMGVVAFFRGKREWNGRFTGAADRIAVESRPATSVDPRHCESSILKAALALSIALADGDLSIAEVRANRPTLEQARDAIEAQLSRLGLKAVRL